MIKYFFIRYNFFLITNLMWQTFLGLANIIANIIGALFIGVQDPYFFLFSKDNIIRNVYVWQ